MKQTRIPLRYAIALIVIGILLGTVFTFGMQYWNETISREDCRYIETRFLGYEEIRQLKRPMEIREIAIDCAANSRYFIDRVSINDDLLTAMSELSEQEPVDILLHPNSNTVLELSKQDETLVLFEDTISKLGSERTSFLFLGIFMYLTAIVGLYYAVLHIIKREKSNI